MDRLPVSSLLFDLEFPEELYISLDGKTLNSHHFFREPKQVDTCSSSKLIFEDRHLAEQRRCHVGHPCVMLYRCSAQLLIPASCYHVPWEAAGDEPGT